MTNKIIIVLSNDFDQNLELNKTTKLRADHAISIFSIGDKIITLGWNGNFKTQDIAYQVKYYIINNSSINKNSIISINKSKDTVGDAFFSREFIEKNYSSKKNIHVISSDWHLMRVKYIFNNFFSNYDIKYHGVKTDNGNMISEKKSIEAFNNTFKNQNFKNLSELKICLYSNHPLYKEL